MVKKMKKWLAELLRSVAYRLSSPLEGMVYYSQEYKIVPICYGITLDTRLPYAIMEEQAMEMLMQGCKKYIEKEQVQYGIRKDMTYKLYVATKER